MAGTSEPSLGLSPVLIEQVFAILARIHADGVPILLVEQNARVALSASQCAGEWRNPFARRIRGADRQPGNPRRLSGAVRSKCRLSRIGNGRPRWRPAAFAAEKPLE